MVLKLRSNDQKMVERLVKCLSANGWTILPSSEWIRAQTADEWIRFYVAFPKGEENNGARKNLE